MGENEGLIKRVESLEARVKELSDIVEAGGKNLIRLIDVVSLLGKKVNGEEVGE